jgi:hypothetical protein
MQNIVKWTAQPDGQYDDLSTMHRATRVQYQRYVNHVQRYIGGRYSNNAPGVKPYEYVPRELQKEAIVWLGKYVLETPLWLYPDEVVEKLGVDAADEIRNRQSTLIAMLTSPGLLFNIHNAELRSPSPYTLTEYLDDIFETVWKPLTAKDERINDYRRMQERAYVDFMGKILNPDEADKKDFSITTQRSDIVLYVEEHVNKIEDYAKAQSSADVTNARHYHNLLLRIKKIREKYESGK